MIKYLLNRIVDRTERLLGSELPYLRTIIAEAPGAVVPVALTMPSGAYGRHAPAEVLHMVRLGATLAQDCGECLDIAVNMARRDRLAASDIEAALAGRRNELPEEYSDAFDFGYLVGIGQEAGESRAAIRARYSERGVIEASMAAASSSFFPALKRGMGYARACEVGSAVGPDRDRLAEAAG